MGLTKTLIHIHTNYSFDSNTAPAALARFAERENIGCIAVTDHDTIEGARHLAAITDAKVIIGSEITTRDGDLIGLFLERRIDPGMSARDTARAIREQGGLVLLPKDFNASFGDLPYDEKVPQYNAQNSLVRSLHPLAYENNPSFLRLVSDTGLPFTSYPDDFQPEAIEQRQELYGQICDLVWDPAAIGIKEPISRAETLRDSDPVVASIGSLLAALVGGEPILTLDQQRPNWITRLDAENVWVETEKTRRENTGPQPVPVDWLESALRELATHGELTQETLDSLGVRRTAFTFAALSQIPGVTTATNPRRLFMSGRQDLDSDANQE